MSAPDISAATNSPDASRSPVKRIEAVSPREHGVESGRMDPTNGTRGEGEPDRRAILQGAPENDGGLEVILGDLDIPSSSTGLITVDELERRYIERVLAVTAGNKSRAAQILGFDRRTLYRKIERYGRSS
jgi:hypothetical protein